MESLERDRRRRRQQECAEEQQQLEASANGNPNGITNGWGEVRDEMSVAA
jgi:hypothetical protein